MYRERCKVLENKKIAPGHYILKLSSARISKNARPGQFVQILCADSHEPLLPRPFSFLTASKKDFSVLFQVVGQGTKILSQTFKGDLLWILGPLGNGFSLSLRGASATKQSDLLSTQIASPRLPQNSADHAHNDILLVGGGVGIPPLYHLAEQFLKSKSKFSRNNIHVLLGARHKSLLLCEKDFKKLGVDLRVATDDGSKGKKGFVTEILEEFLETKSKAKIFTCGPTPMLKAVSLISQKYTIPCEVSVEVPMACGFGACLGCAIKIRHQRTGERFAMACCEGPVFQAREIIWE